MAKEIERKFLVVGDAWRAGARGESFRQGYLSTDKERTVRVRIEGSRGTLTIKGITEGASRSEFEYEVPLTDAAQMLDGLCHQPIIEKTRYRVAHGAHTWEIDVFEGANEGLIVAEIELEHEQEAFDKPAWAGDEVTDDPRYFNSRLVDTPFTTW